MVNEGGEFLPEDGMVLDEEALGFIEILGFGLPLADEIARNANQADVVEPGGHFQDLLLVGRKIEDLGHGPADFEGAAGLVTEGGVERLHGLDAEFDRAIEIALESIVELGELVVLLGATGELQFQLAIELGELLVHGEGGRLESVVAGEELEALDGILDGDEEFLTKPWLDDEPIDLAAINGINDGVEAQHRGDEHSGGIGLNDLGLGEEIKACHGRHLLVGDDDGELLLLQDLERGERIGRGGNEITGADKSFAEGNQHNLLVIDDEDAMRSLRGSFRNHRLGGEACDDFAELVPDFAGRNIRTDDHIGRFEKGLIVFVLVAPINLHHFFYRQLKATNFVKKSWRKAILSIDHGEDGIELIIRRMEELDRGSFGGGGGDVEAVFAESLRGGFEIFAGGFDDKKGFAAEDELGLESFCFAEIRLRQPEAEGGAFVFSRINGDGTVVFFDEEAGVVETEARAFVEGLGGEEGVENLVEVFGGDAGAGILDFDADDGDARNGALEILDGWNFAEETGFEVEIASLGHGVGGVKGKVDENLAKLDGVDVEGELFGGEFGVERDAADGFADDFEGIGDEFVGAVVIALADFALVEAENALDELGGLHGVALDEAKSLKKVVTLIHRALIGLAEGIDPGHDVAEVMSEAHSEDTEGFFPDRRSEAFLGDHLAGDIDPGAIVTENEAVAAEDGFAALQNIGDFACFDVPNAKGGGDGFA